MLPTVEQVHAAGQSFPRPRVDPLSAPTALSPAEEFGLRTAAPLVVELRAETRPMTYLCPSSRRGVVTAGMARHGP